MGANTPRLFEATKVLPELNTSGLENAPDPADTPFADPHEDEVAESTAGEPPAGEVAEAPEAAVAEASAEAKVESEYEAPEKTEETAETPAEETDGFTDEIFERAKRYGWDADAARKFGSPENLDWAIAQADLKAAEWAERQIGAAQPEQAQQVQQTTAQQPAQQQTQEQQAAQIAAIKKVEVESILREKGFDDDSIEAISKINEQYYAQMAALEQTNNALAQLVVAHHQQITGQSQAEAQAQAQQTERELDAFFDGLGPAWETEFGKGPMHKLAEGPAKDARRKLAATAMNLRFADGQLNQQSRSVTEAALSAHNALHFNKKKELALKEVAAKTAQRRTQALPRAGGQRAKPINGRDAAVKKSVEFDRKFDLEAVGGGMQ